MPRPSSPASESPDTSALCACATWCRPNTESIPGRSPIRSSHWLTARLASASPNGGISAICPASANVAASSSPRGTTRLTMPSTASRSKDLSASRSGVPMSWPAQK